MLSESIDKIIEQFKDHLLEVKGKLYTSWRETDTVEFKQSLQISAKGQIISREYLKTIAGFANNKGGIIVFGIHPDTHEITGVKADYEDLDNRYVSTVVREGLDGAFDYRFTTFRVANELIIGVLMVEQALAKPVILRSNIEVAGQAHVAGDIYFRYPAQTARITADDLRALLSQEVARQAQRLLKQVHKLIEIGPDHAAVLDTLTGRAETEVDGQQVRLIMSQEALEQINLIREGKLVETDGAPAYIVKGEIDLKKIEYIEREKEVAKFQSFSQIWFCFLKDYDTDSLNFLQEVICQTTPYYPIFFLARKAGKTDEETIQFLINFNEAGVKVNTRKEIIKRLRSGWTFKETGSLLTISDLNINYDGDLGKQFEEVVKLKNLKGGKGRIKTVARTVALQLLQARNDLPSVLLVGYFRECAEALLHQSVAEIQANREFYMTQLQNLHDTIEFERADANQLSIFRRAICYYDYVLFSERANENG